MAPAKTPTVPEPLALSDPWDEVTINLAAEPIANDHARITMNRGPARLGYIDLDLDAVRALRRWAAHTLEAREATRCQEYDSGGAQCSGYGAHAMHYADRP